MAAASHAPGSEPGVWRTTGQGVAFDTLIEQLTDRLRCEHKRQVDELVAQVSELKSKLESHDQPPAEQPPAEQPPAAQPPAEQPPAEQPPVEQPPAEQPPAEQPPAEQPLAPCLTRSWSRYSSMSTIDENGAAVLREDRAACSDLGPAPGAVAPSPSTAPGRVRRTRAMSISHTESDRSSADGLASAQRRLREVALRASQSSLGIPSRLAPSAIIERIVQSFCFELFFGVLIALQAVVMAVEAHYQSIATAEDLGYERHRGSPGGDWDGAEDVFHMLELTFGVLFSMELLLRVFGLRESFMYDPWNWFDVGIVTLWVMSKFESVLPVSPQLVRLTRFARLARLLKLVRMIQGFDSLIVLTTSIRSSAGILAWSGFCLLLVMIFNALVLNGLLTEFYFRRATFPISERLEIFRYFGSFTSSLFSMFELTLANWPPISRALYENVSGWFILVTLVHKFTVGFAVIGIINGVFIQETFRVAQQDDEIMLRRGEKAMCIHANKMKRLVETADSSGEGMLDIGEFRLMFQDPGIKAWLGSMELNPRDVDSLFAMMDDGDGYLSVDEVIRGVGLYKGAARSIDLHMLAQEHRNLQAVVLRLHYNVLSRLGKSDDGLQDTSLSRLGQSDDDIDI